MCLRLSSKVYHVLRCTDLVTYLCAPADVVTYLCAPADVGTYLCAQASAYCLLTQHYRPCPEMFTKVQICLETVIEEVEPLALIVMNIVQSYIGSRSRSMSSRLS